MTGGIVAARRRPTVAMEVRLHLRRQIVEGHLAPGHPLSENDVAAQLGVSRTPVREAFIKLEDEGLIAVYPQYGSFVAPIRMADVYDSQFVREAVECAALEKVIERLDAAGAAMLEAMLVTQHGYLAGDPDPFFEADESFHATLLRLAGHERAWLVVEAAKGQHDRVRRMTVRDPLKRRAVFDEHSAVVAAVLARDPVAAVAAMRRHLRGVFVSVESVMQQNPEFFALTAESAMRLPKRPAKPRRVPQ